MVRRALWCLVIGVAMNVAVAWYVPPFLTGPIYGDSQPEAEAVDRYVSNALPHWPAPDHNEVFGGQGRSTGFEAEVAVLIDGATIRNGYGPKPDEYSVGVCRMGLPLLCLKKTTLRDPIGEQRSGIMPIAAHRPTEPIWIPFLLNTILYASVVWAILRGIVAMIRRSRRRRGRCVRCRYPVFDSGCPECGLGYIA